MSNYPPGVSGFEPQIAGYDERENIMEVECGYDPCRYALEVPVTETYSHDVVQWYAVWVCPSCNEENEKEGWYDPNDDN